MWVWLRRWTWDQWQRVHDEHPPERRLDARPLVALVVATVVMTLQYYLGDRDTYSRIWPMPTAAEFVRGDWELGSYAWWTAWRVAGYMLVPLVVIAAWRGERLRDWGLGARGFAQHVWIAGALLAAVLPIVVAASFTTPFRETYPFYKLANRSTTDLLAWELMYGLQFLSLEFFFRGFLLHGLVRAMGAHAIWVTMVPYVMIHYDKPLPETLAAIAAGIALGTLALRTRSIWTGVLIHVSVALTMDLLAVAHCPDGRPCPAPTHPLYESYGYDGAAR